MYISTMAVTCKRPEFLQSLLGGVLVVDLNLAASDWSRYPVAEMQSYFHGCTCDGINAWQVEGTGITVEVA